MNMLGYLVTLMNLQNFNNNGTNSINNLAIKVAEVGSIANEIMKDNVFHINDFRETGYYRRYNIGIYISRRVQDYLYNKNVSSTDEGVMLTLFFSDSRGPEGPGTKLDASTPPKESLTYYLRKPNKGRVSNDAIATYLDSFVNNKSK